MIRTARYAWPLLLILLGFWSVRAATPQETRRDDNPALPPATDHWSFKPAVRPTVPAVKNTAWVRNPLDNFVLAKLESLGISPSPEADRVTLIRRLSLDLLGLPPTPAEVNAFVKDDRPDPYERLIEQLLQSPHFGERWARHWLDLARYADSDGYEKDSPRPFAYLYRNWVIDAINRDLPFDQFTIEQLAGDLLPGATLEQMMATGFHRNTLTNKEGGVDQEEYRNRANVDRVNTTATVWLGLTLGCCECHNHKYDPFTQQEFYRLFSFFNTSQELDVPAPQPAEVAAYEQAKKTFDEDTAKLQTALAEFEKDKLPGRVAEWESALKAKLPASRWVVLEPVHVSSSGGATLTQQPDGSIEVAGKSPSTDTYTIEVKTELTGITAFRLEVLADPKHPAKGPGRVKHGNFVLNEFTVKLATGDVSEPRPVPLHNATADFSQEKYAVAGAIDGNPQTGWAVAPQLGQRHVAVFETKEDLAAAGTTLVFTLDQEYGSEHTIGRLRISATTAPRPVRADDIPDDVAESLRVEPHDRNEQQKTTVVQFFRTTDADWKKLNDPVTDHAKKAPPPPATKAMTIAQNAKPPQTHVHIRGDFLRKGDEVQPGTPAVLVSFKPRGEQPDRIDLACWLMDPENPLTARVTVNRVWQNLFGKGLVATPNDFGTRGEQPSHPDLLDWLASEFSNPSPCPSPLGAEGRGEGAARPWSTKSLIKLIVTSATYRQSSRTRPDLGDRDPTNSLLARQNRYRLEAEIVRDLCLATSGLLTPAVGGPSVRPPQPAGVSDLTYAGSAKWAESTGPDRYRRGMYTHFQRTSPYPMLMTFDSPDGVVCTVRRERSNTPLQALTLLNDAVFVECAQGLARRVIREAPSADPNERLRYALRLCVAREPTSSEVARLSNLYRDLLDACRANPDTAMKLVGQQPPADTDVSEAAANVALARAIMNLDEFVTRE